MINALNKYHDTVTQSQKTLKQKKKHNINFVWIRESLICDMYTAYKTNWQKHNVEPIYYPGG